MSNDNHDAAVLQFPEPRIKPNVAALLPLFNEIPDGSPDLFTLVISGAAALSAEHEATATAGISRAAQQRVVDALFMPYWASGRLLGLHGRVDLGTED